MPYQCVLPLRRSIRGRWWEPLQRVAPRRSRDWRRRNSVEAETVEVGRYARRALAASPKTNCPSIWRPCHRRLMLSGL
eukprot:scaffold1724_cov246-Pinguiococcus_pyrenoidosus.AAC.10